jgi:hypothetical protein
MIRLEFVADLEPRRQIGEPLRRGINERGLHALVNAGQDQRTEDDEEAAESDLDDLAGRHNLRASAPRAREGRCRAKAMRARPNRTRTCWRRPATIAGLGPLSKSMAK